MTKDITSAIDPCGYKRRLDVALRDPRLQNHEASGVDRQDAATWVAIALGNCRLFGIDTQELDGILPIETAVDACESVRRLTGEFKSRVDKLTDDFEELDDDATLVACQILTDRMDLWAADVAIVEAWEVAVVESEAGYLELDSNVTLLTECIAELDKSLKNCEGVLFTAASTNLLSNWRGLLCEDFRAEYPWWLDGSIEREYASREALANKLIPAE
jgi:hypothetical protein